MNYYQAKSRDELVLRYGNLVRTDADTLSWPDERKWMSLVILPSLTQTITNSGSNQPWDKVYINKDAAKPLVDVIELLHIRNKLSEWHTYDGCFNPRDVRGMPGIPSMHSWGLAIDLNAADNKLNTSGKLSQDFVACFLDLGWIWGGHFKRCDPMHFQFCGSF